MRIAILGNSGSGKSTLALGLSGAQGWPRLDLDTVAWEPGKIAVPRDPERAQADVRHFCAGASWVVEGCYGSLVKVALERGGVLLFLDPGSQRCLDNCRLRPWEAHKYASKAEQDAGLTFLLEWVASYERREGELSRTGHEEVFLAHDGTKFRLTEMVSPEEVMILLAT